MAPRTSRGGRGVRADAQRNIEAVLRAARIAFATTGVDTPVRDIAAAAGVGTGTIYRHFPSRTDLVAAVFQRELEACAGAASELAATYAPIEALRRWLLLYIDLLATKHGLVTAMYSDAPTYEALGECLQEPLRPALRHLLDNAAASGSIRRDVRPDDLLQAVATLCLLDTEQTERMVMLLLDGLRFGATAALEPAGR